MTESIPATTTEEELPAELLALGQAIAKLPGAQFAGLEPHYAQVVECFRRRRRILSLVQEALSQLRLDVKYLLFDLDATRQERDQLKSELDVARQDDFDVSGP